jgi:Xaa-Pro dipeptidase
MTMPTFEQLTSMVEDVQPITAAERQQRLAKAQELMARAGLDAIYLEAGPALRYFTGVQWGLSERLLGAVIPACGEVSYVCPGFEGERLHEQLTIGERILLWEEHESPYRLMAQLLRECGAAAGAVGVEEAVRHFVFDGIRREAPALTFVSADAVTIPCRAYKSAAEIALLQRANDITAAAYQASLPHLCEGLTQREFRDITVAAHRALGVEGAIWPVFGASTAYPHGSIAETQLHEGDMIVMDGSCTVDGYYSDISRSLVFGQPTQRMRDIWELEHAAQQAAFAAAQLGAPMESMDAAARQVIVNAGLGPGYAVPGLPHRTGHGVGLEIHEWHNVVQGNTTPLAPGLCFSDEPMICLYGEFGIRLEDCIYMSDDGPRFFSQPSPAIEHPFA